MIKHGIFSFLLELGLECVSTPVRLRTTAVVEAEEEEDIYVSTLRLLGPLSTIHTTRWMFSICEKTCRAHTNTCQLLSTPFLLGNGQNHKESTNTNINNLSMKALPQGWALAMLMAKTSWSVLRRATETGCYGLVGSHLLHLH